MGALYAQLPIKNKQKIIISSSFKNPHESKIFITLILFSFLLLLELLTMEKQPHCNSFW